MNKIKWIILVLIILLVIICSVTIYLMNNFKEDDKQSIVEQGDAGEIINYEENKVEPVKDSTDFFTVNNCINTYLNTINQNNSAYYGMNEKNEYVKIVTDARNKSEYI